MLAEAAQGGASSAVEVVSSYHSEVAATTQVVTDAVAQIASVGTPAALVISDAADKRLPDVISIGEHAVAEVMEDLELITRLLHPFLHPAVIVAGGHSRKEINMALLVIIGAVCACTATGFAFAAIGSRLIPQKVGVEHNVFSKDGRPHPWVVGLLLASYGVLVPGLTQVLFSFALGIQWMGIAVVVTRDRRTGELGPITESMCSTSRALVESGSWSGAALVVLYAMIIPAVKLVFLGLGEWWRCSTDPAQVRTARNCVHCVQVMSKWACPDMFAYIFLLYLMRSIDKRSSFINLASQLDIGFICFSVFCICSTFTSLAIQLPREQTKDVGMKEPPLLIRHFGHRGVVWATGVLNIAFTILLVLGLVMPCMGLQIDATLLVEPAGTLPAALKPFLDRLHLADQINAEVSVVQCIAALSQWLYHWEASCILALVMLAGFAVLFSVLDVIALLCAASMVAKEGQVGRVNFAMSVAHILRHISMLDVLIMGVVVVCGAAGAYRAQGLVLSLRWGLALLLAAESLHYFTYYCVQDAVLYTQSNDDE